jgi:hypothetical protein
VVHDVVVIRHFFYRHLLVTILWYWDMKSLFIMQNCYTCGSVH